MNVAPERAAEEELAAVARDSRVGDATHRLVALCQRRPLHIAVIALRDGRARCLNPGRIGFTAYKVPALLAFLENLGRGGPLPDGTFAFNLLDEARVMPWPGQPFSVRESAARYARCALRAGRPEAAAHPALFAPRGRAIFHAPVALLSTSKVRGLHGDALLPDPTLHELATELARGGPAPDHIPWDRKTPRLYWRGATTGGVLTLRNWARFPRIRLALAARGQPAADCALHALIQCPVLQRPLLRWILRRQGVLKPGRHPFETNYQFRFVYDLEGNSYSTRLKHLLRSRSVVVRPAPIWEEYFHRWMAAGTHYVQLGPDLAGLDALVKAEAGPMQAIAAAANDLVATTMTADFLYRYTAALLRHYREVTDMP